MEEEHPKSDPTTFTQMDQVHSDFALALLLQEQERALTMLTTLESGSDGSDGDESGSSDGHERINDFDFDFFVNQDIHAELEYQEGEDSHSDQEMDEADDIDPDQLSYEDLIALGEIVGEESRGLSPNEISSYMRPTSVDCTKSDIDRCVICQVEYQEGEELVALSCHHPYHSHCIIKWLQIKKICPICSTEVSSMPQCCL